MASQLEDIRRNLSAFVRHLLPGVLVIGAFYLRRPQWFDAMMPAPSPWHLAVLTIVGLAIGNLLYFINRYGIVHGIEAIGFTLQVRGRLQEYASHTCNAIDNFYASDPLEFRQLIHLREAAGHYLLIAGEAAFIAAWDTDALFRELRWPVFVLGLVCLITGAWLLYITRQITLARQPSAG